MCLPDDLAVAVLGGMDDGDVAVAALPDATLRLALEHQDDFGDLLVEVGGHELLVESTRGSGAVLPPPVRSGADDVGAVDDEDRHLRYLEKSCGSSSAAAAFS